MSDNDNSDDLIVNKKVVFSVKDLLNYSLFLIGLATSIAFVLGLNKDVNELSELLKTQNNKLDGIQESIGKLEKELGEKIQDNISSVNDDLQELKEDYKYVKGQLQAKGHIGP
ncbi:MAG: hypothetical protein HEP71_25130 [Roseivirga sp.]|nr:hypothetical protein [Roseivirga sp.]